MLKTIYSEKQYEEALARTYELLQLDIKVDSDVSNELEALSISIKEYELTHHLIVPIN